MVKGTIAAMVELNKIEKRVVVLVLAALFAVMGVRWWQAESAKVNLSVVSEEELGVQR